MPLGEMKVREVQEGNLIRVEPEYQDDWSDLTKLRWEAALATLRGGEKITVHIANYSTNGIWNPGFYGLSGYGWGCGPLSFEAARDTILGYEMGASAAKRREIPMYATPIFGMLVTRYALQGSVIASKEKTRG